MDLQSGKSQCTKVELWQEYLWILGDKGRHLYEKRRQNIVMSKGILRSTNYKVQQDPNQLSSPIHLAQMQTRQLFTFVSAADSIWQCRGGDTDLFAGQCIFCLVLLQAL
jgi:hypothetical protein